MKSNSKNSNQIFTFGILFAIGFAISCHFINSITPTKIPDVTATPTISPLEARVGVWEGTTQFGSFIFEVSPDGMSIIDLRLHWEAGGGVFRGNFTLTSLPMPINDDDSFKLDLPEDFVFEAQFSDDGTSASGFWEMIKPIQAFEKWEINNHILGYSELSPTSTQIGSTPLASQDSFTNAEFWVCEYLPGGNYIGERPY